jgi:hypothetical protein
MFLKGLWEALEASPVGQYVASSSWAFPTLESLHVMAIVTVLGTIVVMDLRLLGLASKDRSVTAMSNDTLRWTWGAFCVAMLTGGLLFMAKATEYAVNPNFQLKMVLIVLAGVNMAVFHLFTWRTVDKWDSDPVLPLAAKIAGGLSLFLWVVTVFFARAIGFTLDMYMPA